VPANPFLPPAEQALIDRFLADGHVVVPAEDRAALDRIRGEAVRLAADHLGVAAPVAGAEGVFLETVHQRVDPAKLNALRLAVIQGLNAADWLRPAYFATARRTLEALVGNELAMQLRVNLSIQLPGDDSSLLPIHADVWNGDSPYEVVLWVPLVDCCGTKSMFLLPPGPDAVWQPRLAEFAGRGGAEALYRAVEPDLKFLDVPYGQVLVFSQNLMHGNRVNVEAESRWSMNCRFKAALTPYADKKLGEFFEPITVRPATRLGSAFRLPGGFRE
jgi:sporadic carbohydrate cluster 2OG-Fe(II) oxygenase